MCLESVTCGNTLVKFPYDPPGVRLIRWGFDGISDRIQLPK
jgi:hypothetical protein